MNTTHHVRHATWCDDRRHRRIPVDPRALLPARPVHHFSRGGEPLTYSGSYDGHEGGLHFSAVEAATVVGGGGTESAIHPPSAVLATLDVMDLIRAEIGVVYPGEEQ